MKKIRIIAIISALVTAAAVYVYLQSLKKPPEVQLYPVVVASVPIAEGQEIQESMVAVRMLPAEAIADRAATNTADVVGRISSASAEKGEQLLVSRFYKAGEASKTGGLAEALEKGRRAFTVAVDAVGGVAGLIMPRDSVDVLIIVGITSESPDQSGTALTTTYSKLLLQNIRVLATGQTIIPGSDTADPKTYDTVTLSVTPDEAVRLNLAASEGKVRLVLRSPIDTDEPAVQQVEVKDLVDSK